MNNVDVWRCLMSFAIDRLEAAVLQREVRQNNVVTIFACASLNENDARRGEISIPDEGLFDWIVGYTRLFPDDLLEVDRILCALSALHRTVADPVRRIGIILDIERRSDGLECAYEEQNTPADARLGGKFDIVVVAYRYFAGGAT